MRPIKFIFLGMLLFCHSIFAETQSFAAVKLSELLNQFTTLQAQFKQTTVDASNHLLQHSYGRVMIQRPGRFRWETQSPTHQIVITDGKILWVYDVDLKQATKQAIQKSAINPAKLLSGNIHDLLKDFTIHLIVHSSAETFQLIPKKLNQQFHSLSMTFVHEKLSNMQIHSTLNQTTTFAFSDVRLNTHLDPLLFEFKAPSGVDVLQ